MSNEHDDIVKQAEEIVKQIQSGSLALTSKARTVILSRELGKDALGRIKKENRNLTDIIGNDISEFLRLKSIKKSPSLEDYLNQIILSKKRLGLHNVSCELIQCIELARAKRVLKNTGIENLQKEVEDLREQLDRYEKENLKLKQENKDLHTLVKNLGGESTSDVESSDQDE